jgi:DNA-binding Lrp family transcriptional regulator
MVVAYILAIVKSGSERDVIEQLQKEDRVKEVSLVYGEYDVLIKVELGEISELSDFVLDKIRSIPAIERTTTLIVAS